MKLKIEIKKYIDVQDIQSFLTLMFEDNNQRIPLLREGYRHERELWDFKSEVPGSGKRHEPAWAEIARHVLAFHNADGGFLIFGINDTNFEFTGARNFCDSSRFNNAIRKYVGDLFHVIFNRAYIQEDQSYLGIALIPAKRYKLVRFLADAPRKSGGRLFSRGDIAIREGDSSRTYRGSEANELVSDQAITRTGRGYAIDEENYRILSPEYRSFVYRRKLCDEIMDGLQDPRVAVVSVVGIGGVGKTALATWAALEAYRNNMFSFIVSITAKDRELTAKSIVPLDSPLSSYEELIFTIIKVLNLSELLGGDSFEEKQELAHLFMKDSNGLLYVDNLETVDDSRIVNMLERLPLGVRALVTSRIPRIRRSNYPVDVGPLEDYEVHDFLDALVIEPQFEYLDGFTDSDRIAYAQACNRIPLPMRWIAARCKNTRQALSQARDININSTTSEELLEFSFRRIFDQLSEDERHILKTMSVYRRPLAAEAIHIASDIPYRKLVDLLTGLSELSLVEVLYDEEISHDVFALLPITSSFVYGEIKKTDDDFERTVRSRMNHWLNANDISDPVRKALTKRMRQGQESSEEILLELAQDYQRKGAIVDAEQLYREALDRNPKSWKVHRRYAEFLRHFTNEKGKALHHYKEAAQHVPKKEDLRGLVFRELGILLKQSGNLNGLQESTEALEHSFQVNSKDPITVNVLAGNYLNLGRISEAIKILEPFRKHPNLKSREYVLNTLLQCYEHNEDTIEVAYVKREIEDLARSLRD